MTPGGLNRQLSTVDRGVRAELPISSTLVTQARDIHSFEGVRARNEILAIQGERQKLSEERRNALRERQKSIRSAAGAAGAFAISQGIEAFAPSGFEGDAARSLSSGIQNAALTSVVFGTSPVGIVASVVTGLATFVGGLEKSRQALLKHSIAVADDTRAILQAAFLEADPLATQGTTSASQRFTLQTGQLFRGDKFLESGTNATSDAIEAAIDAEINRRKGGQGLIGSLIQSVFGRDEFSDRDLNFQEIRRSLVLQDDRGRGFGRGIGDVINSTTKKFQDDLREGVIDPEDFQREIRRSVITQLETAFTDLGIELNPGAVNALLNEAITQGLVNDISGNLRSSSIELNYSRC